MNRTRFALGIFLAAASVFAQSEKPAPSANNASAYAGLAKAPPKAATRRNPFENDPQALAAGAKLFELHCSECHGSAAQGGKKAPGLLADEIQQASPGTLFWILTNGVVRRGMPVWSKLPEPQRWQLVSYLKSLRPSSKPSSVSSSPQTHD